MKKRVIFATIACLILVVSLGLIARPRAKESDKAATPTVATASSLATLPQASASSAVKRNPDRDAFFGETHIHTSWSFDAYIFGNTKAGPEDAYKFAMGQTITHPAGYPIKITRPLDFMAVTDHAEYVGIVPLANDPNSPISKLPIAEKLKVEAKKISRKSTCFWALPCSRMSQYWSW